VLEPEPELKPEPPAIRNFTPAPGGNSISAPRLSAPATQHWSKVLKKSDVVYDGPN
jgi:hypothetical protein